MYRLWVASNRGARRVRDMTTLMIVDWDPDEPRLESIMRRLRMEFARLGISDSEAARRAGISQDRMSRRMTGKTPFDVNDLDLICRELGISFNFVTTGIRELPSGPPGGGGRRLPGNPFDPAPQPSGSMSVAA